MSSPTIATHHEQRSSTKLLSKQKLIPGAWEPGNHLRHPGGLSGFLLPPSWLPDQLQSWFQCKGTSYHSLQLSGPGSSLHHTCPSPTRMLHTGFLGLTLLSVELPPTSPLVPRSGVSGAREVRPQAWPPLPLLVAPYAFCKLSPMFLPWGKC